MFSLPSTTLGAALVLFSVSLPLHAQSSATREAWPAEVRLSPSGESYNQAATALESGNIEEVERIASKEMREPTYSLVFPYLLGEVRIQQHREAEAFALFKEAAAFETANGDSDKPENMLKNAAKKKVAELQPRLRIVVSLQKVANLQARVDGEPVPLTDLLASPGYPIDPGKHEIRLERLGGGRTSATFLAEVRKASDVSMEIPGSLSAPRKNESTNPQQSFPEAEEYWTTPRVLSGVATLAGLATAVTGTVLYARAEDYHSSNVEDYCRQDACRASARAAVESYDGRTKLAQGLIIGGAIVAASLAITFLVLPSKREVQSTDVEPIYGPNADVGIDGIVLHGSF